jgi:hypothetical protein
VEQLGSEKGEKVIEEEPREERNVNPLTIE